MAITDTRIQKVFVIYTYGRHSASRMCFFIKPPFDFLYLNLVFVHINREMNHEGRKKECLKKS